MQIHQIGGYGNDSNIYLIIDEVITLIDAGTGKHFNRVVNNLRKLGLAPGDIQLIINTHCHYDHVGGDHAFISASGCGVAVHEFDAEPLRRGDGIITCATVLGEELKPLEPTRLLHESDRIKLGKSALEVIHTPGHTQGSICLYERTQRALFSGDTVFCGGIGRTDWPTGDSKAMAKSLRRLAELDIEELFPGHGPFDLKDAKEYIGAALGFLSEYNPKR